MKKWLPLGNTSAASSLLVILMTCSLASLPRKAAALVSPVQNDGWRVAMDIGREPETGMSPEWAKSGCRLPLVIRCDFLPDEGRGNGKDEGSGGTVTPKTSDVRFTAPGGEVVNKIERGEWTVSPRDGKGRQDLSFTFSFPEELVRRDVRLQGTVQCTGSMYSTEALKEIDAGYYTAREERWEAGKIMNEVLDKEDAPRKWNTETEQWERRYEEEGLLSRLGKRAGVMLAERREKKVIASRPRPKDLSSDCGPFPGVGEAAYVKKGGKVVLVEGWRKLVIGTWSAEPINDRPLSYY